MEIIKNNTDIVLKTKDFNPVHVFECGQCFRWDKTDSGYAGVAYGKRIEVIPEPDGVRLAGAADDFESIWRSYFDLDTDYSAIKSSFADGDIMDKVLEFGSGIRILRQEPFEALISFIISASNNISRIRKIVASLCENFGEKIEDGVYAFPTPQRLAALSEEEIAVIRAGFRGKYIISAAKAVAEGVLDLDSLYPLGFEEARKELTALNGVGPKVAGCVLLFGFSKTDAYPVDVWVKRISERIWFKGEATPQSRIEATAREKFGSRGGYAQQYLFYWARENLNTEGIQ